tara:strand:- start:6792 stop:7220 length:429 start_codon:yes stop_codon:yes gene_type:complete
MNKILGPDKSAPIWYSASSKRSGKTDTPADLPAAEPMLDAADVTLNVALFGYLSTKAENDRLTLSVPGNAKVRDVIEIIGEACGPEIAATFKNDSGEFIECCRIFVEGVLRDDLNALISPNNGQNNHPADIEIILLMANEAG